MSQEFDKSNSNNTKQSSTVPQGDKKDVGNIEADAAAQRQRTPTAEGQKKKAQELNEKGRGKDMAAEAKQAEDKHVPKNPTGTSASAPQKDTPSLDGKGEKARELNGRGRGRDMIPQAMEAEAKHVQSPESKTDMSGGAQKKDTSTKDQKDANTTNNKDQKENKDKKEIKTPPAHIDTEKKHPDMKTQELHEKQALECKTRFWEDGVKCAAVTTLAFGALAISPPLRTRIPTALKVFLPATFFAPSFYLCGSRAERECIRSHHKVLETPEPTYEEMVGQKVKENLKT